MGAGRFGRIGPRRGALAKRVLGRTGRRGLGGNVARVSSSITVWLLCLLGFREQELDKEVGKGLDGIWKH